MIGCIIARMIHWSFQDIIHWWGSGDLVNCRLRYVCCKLCRVIEDSCWYCPEFRGFWRWIWPLQLQGCSGVSKILYLQWHLGKKMVDDSRYQFELLLWCLIIWSRGSGISGDALLACCRTSLARTIRQSMTLYIHSENRPLQDKRFCSIDWQTLLLRLRQELQLRAARLFRSKELILLEIEAR